MRSHECTHTHTHRTTSHTQAYAFISVCVCVLYIIYGLPKDEMVCAHSTCTEVRVRARSLSHLLHDACLLHSFAIHTQTHTRPHCTGERQREREVESALVCRMKNFHTIVVVFGIGVVSRRARYSADVFFARMHTRSACVRVCCSSPRALALRYAYYLKSLRKTFHSALARGECALRVRCVACKYTHTAAAAAATTCGWSLFCCCLSSSVRFCLRHLVQVLFCVCVCFALQKTKSE